jgi:RNA polymerase sigma-70 factor (ECF subfamily)
MQEAQPFVSTARCEDVYSQEIAVQQMEDVLASRLPSFYRSAYQFLGNAADAEDAVQEALLSAHKHLGQFKGQSQMSTWLTAIVRNSALMNLRKRPRQFHVSLDERLGEEEEYSLSDRLVDNKPTPEDEFRAVELSTRLQELAQQLSPSLRRAFVLRDLNGLSTTEAARILGVTEGTVKAQLSRARSKLRQIVRRKHYRKPGSGIAINLRNPKRQSSTAGKLIGGTDNRRKSLCGSFD